MTARRRSCEIIEELAKKVGYRYVADKMRLAEITIRKWSEKSKRGQDDLPFEPSGRENPIDRVEDLLHIMVTEDQRNLAVETINHMARELSGVFITSEDLDQILNTLLRVQEQDRENKLQQVMGGRKAG